MAHRPRHVVILGRLSPFLGALQVQRHAFGNLTWIRHVEAYKWKSDKLHQLETDLLKIVAEGETHFLGAIIAYGRGGNPADPNVFEVIDGQQRITTVFLYVCAIVRTLCLSGRYEDAEGLFVEYLAIDRETRLASNSRLHCCKEDRAQLNKVFDDVLSDRT